jgi:UDP-glucose 4-epimerase
LTILITGGTGLVGPRLLSRFVSAGIECRGLARVGKQLPAGVAAVEGDILSPDTLPAAVAGVSAVVHLAALFRTRDDEQIWKVNVEGTRNLIAAVKEHAPEARFLMASTANIYDDNASHPGREDDEVAPTLSYPASKYEAEKELQSSRLNWGILRLPFIYGDKDGHLEGLPELAAGMNWHPAARLSVIHHEDIATAFELALSGAMDGRIVNVADEAPLTVYEIAQIVGSSYEASAEPLANPWKGQMNVTLARSLGFRAKVPTIYTAVRENKL